MLRIISLSALLAVLGLVSGSALAQRAHIDPESGELIVPPEQAPAPAKAEAPASAPLDVEEFVADDGRRGLRIPLKYRHHLRVTLPRQNSKAADAGDD